MAKSGPIVIVEDDQDDREMLQEAFKDLKVNNRLIFFDRCSKAFTYLKETRDQPFIILSDINIPEKNGIEFKRQIDEDPQLRAKSIPFAFFSTSADNQSVDTAYKEFTVQGFFQKTNRYEELKTVLKLIIDYWKVCKHPNS